MDMETVVMDTQAPVKTKKRNLGTIIFYSIYGLFVIASIVGILCLLNPLNDWLVKYQASQPETKCQEVFDRYFASPDWAELYALVGIEDTAFEDSADYAADMEEKQLLDEALIQTYKKKGMDVVQANWAAVDRAAEYLRKYDVPSSISNFAPDFIPAMTWDTPAEILF